MNGWRLSPRRMTDRNGALVVVAWFESGVVLLNEPFALGPAQ